VSLIDNKETPIINPQLNSSSTDERIATQECSTGVTEADIKKKKTKK
jgi:hypothetical protein